ncbi:CHC2 zinc finger domain-containing protein [Corynebacterium pseudodiphtheriticum]|uniref:Zinc finger protein n=1 Tax=Siphoviridae sp. ctGkF2 TaxID=2827823 RepID=A0A8S5TL95_9CAUD|nr:MAG TPA: zinc finger protein [Siphoviridae sp. ctGkF2]
MIEAVMAKYFPGWDPPEDDGRTWIPAECPVHGDENPSAGVSYELNSFVCHACGYSGDVYKIIQQEEGVDFAEATQVAETIAGDSGVEIPRSLRRKRRRRISRPARFSPA